MVWSVTVTGHRSEAKPSKTVDDAVERVWGDETDGDRARYRRLLVETAFSPPSERPGGVKTLE
jgi:hypothetical protein